MKDTASFIRMIIAEEAKKAGVSECEMIGEIMRQTLDPHREYQCDGGCHVTWLELYAKLDEVLK